MATNVQPAGHTGMQIPSHRNPMNLPLDQSGKRDWSFPLFGCCDECGTCFLACFCPCVVYSRINTRLDHLANNGSPHPTGGDGCDERCFVYTVVACLGVSFLLVACQRGATRDHYNIAGGGTDCCATIGCTKYCGSCDASDVTTAWFCQLCDLVQRTREIELEERSYSRST